MFTSRFVDDDNVERATPPAPAMNGFLLMSVAPGMAAPVSSMQWLYQRLYEEAQKANQPKPMPELFAVMN